MSYVLELLVDPLGKPIPIVFPTPGFDVEAAPVDSAPRDPHMIPTVWDDHARNAIAVNMASKGQEILGMLGVDLDTWCAISIGGPLGGLRFDTVIVMGDWREMFEHVPDWFTEISRRSKKLVWL